MKIPLHWRYSALSLISSTWCQLEWVNIDTAGWSQRSAVCSQQKCLCCLIVNSRQSVMFSKSAVFLFLCMQAFGLMPGIGGLVMEEEGLAANCTTRLMAAKMGQMHGYLFYLWNVSTKEDYSNGWVVDHFLQLIWRDCKGELLLV